MQLPIFYSEQSIYGNSGLLSEDTSKHIVQVLRMQPGQQILLTNGKGLLQTASILSAHKKTTSVKIIDEQKLEFPKRKIIIGISPVKNMNRFEWFLEKATEIGVTDIIILKSTRTERHQIRYDRMNQILIAAMLQSRQVWLPNLSDLLTLESVIKNNTSQNKFIAHCLDGDKLNLLDSAQLKNEDIITLIGPEGDFTEDEINFALNHNFKPVTLGKNRLRTETAGIAACILMKALEF